MFERVCGVGCGFVGCLWGFVGFCGLMFKRYVVSGLTLELCL